LGRVDLGIYTHSYTTLTKGGSQLSRVKVTVRVIARVRVRIRVQGFGLRLKVRFRLAFGTG